MALAAHGPRPSVPSQAEQAGNSKQISLGIERRVDDLIERIRPNKASDTRRKIASDYVKGLIRGCFSPVEKVEAFMFGSVPLKTYLPDGDIDLAVFQEKGPKLRESWTTDLKNYLQSETVKAAPQYRIKDVQIINAEVKLLKCLVDNIVVDISFDTIGGICTVLFLESIDRLIGQEHLFKRSIILVKAWCYYESRLLGAHHSLLSTYALETMVLYIFNMYVEELSSPLKVLRKFLDVFSAFDWDNKALSLQGPIPLSAFDDPKGMKAELRSDVMLKEHILESMLNMYRPPREQGPVTRAFIRRFNIVDPLLPTNNLGKSINIASKYRIREALTHGARVLTSIFAKSGQEALDAVDSFFESTWGAQAIPASQPLAEAHPLPPLMLPLPLLSAPAQPHLSRQSSQAEAHALAAHAAMGSYALAAAQNGMPALPLLHTKSVLHSRRNSSDDSEGRNLSRTFSGPLPERPRSSASNASTGSDTQPNTPPFSMTRRGAAEAWARFHPSRPGSLLGPQSSAADMNGYAAHMSHDGRLQQGHATHASSNGGAPAANGHMMPPFPAYPLPGVPYHVAVPASNAQLLQYHHLPAGTAPYGYAPPVSMVNGHMYSSQQPIMYPVSFPGIVPHGGHRHQNGTQGLRSEPAQGKRGAGVVSSTAQEAKEDLLAGDLELLSGHLEKAKRCHIHVTSTDSSSPAPAVQPKPVATQQAKQAPESPTVMQQEAAPARAPQRRQPEASSQRPANTPAPAQQGQPSQLVRPHSQAAGQVPSYKAAATKMLPPRATSVNGADLQHMHPPSTASASPAPAAAKTPAPSPASAGAAQPWSASVSPAPSAAPVLASAAAPAAKLGTEGPALSGSTELPAPPPPINILRRPEAAEDSLSVQLLPPGPPLTPSIARTAQLGQPLELSSEPDEVRSMPGSSHGSDARSMQAASRSELGSPVAGNAASAPGLWATRTLADAVRQGPQASSSSSQPAQHQLRPPAAQPMGHYQSAVLGLGRPHPKSPQPAAPPPLTPAQHAASAAPVMEQQQKVPSKAQRQREYQPGKAAQPANAAQLPGAPANERSSSTPAQTPAAIAATNQFTLSDGDFPTLGAAGSGRRRVPKAEDPSPSSSAAATPKVRDSRLPSFSASSSPAVPRWGPAAKAQQAPAQGFGSSPVAQRWASKPDAKAAVQLLPADSDKGCVSRSEGSSPTAAGRKGSAWTGQISHAVLTGTAKGQPPHASPSARTVPQRPASAQPSSRTARKQQ